MVELTREQVKEIDVVLTALNEQIVQIETNNNQVTVRIPTVVNGIGGTFVYIPSN